MKAVLVGFIISLSSPGYAGSAIGILPEGGLTCYRNFIDGKNFSLRVHMAKEGLFYTLKSPNLNEVCLMVFPKNLQAKESRVICRKADGTVAAYMTELDLTQNMAIQVKWVDRRRIEHTWVYTLFPNLKKVRLDGTWYDSESLKLIEIVATTLVCN